MKDITYHIVDSVSKIKREDWNAVFANTHEGYQFYELLEASGLQEFNFYYLLVYEADKLVLIAPLFVADFNLDIAAGGLIKQGIGFLRKFFPRLLIIKTLFCGSPFGEHGVLGMQDHLDDKNRLTAGLVKRMEVFCREEKISFILFKDFLKKETMLLDTLLRLGFFRVNSFPSAVTELNFSSFEEYLGSLGHSTRKNLRRKIKDAYATKNIKVEMRDSIDDIIDDIYSLYLNTYGEGKTKFEKLTREFFLSVGEKMAPYARFFLYYVDAKLSTFNLCFVYPDLFVDKFIGFDYNTSQQAHLYFVSWCYNIEWCLKYKIPFYQSGQTDYDAKIRLGAKLIPLYAYLKHLNPGINVFFRLLSEVFKPENFDGQIRQDPSV